MTPFGLAVQGVVASPRLTSPAPTFTSLLLHFDTPGAATADSSLNGFTTNTDSIVYNTGNPYFGNGSAHLNGIDTYCTFNSAAPLDLTTGDFTVQLFVWPDSAGTNLNKIITSKQAGSGFYAFQLFWNPNTGKVNFAGFDNSNVSAYSITSGNSLVLDAWNYVIGRRTGNVFELGLNGVSEGTANSSAALRSNANDPINIGAGGNGGNIWQGWFDELRILKGYADVLTVPGSAFPNPT